MRKRQSPRDRLFLIHSLESYGAEETRLLGETVTAIHVHTHVLCTLGWLLTLPRVSTV